MAGTRSSSTRCGRRSAGAAAGCPACTRSTCRRTCSTRWSQRTGLDPALVEDVIWGCVSQTGEQAVNVGRNAALAAGWPEDVVGRDDRPAVRVVAAGGALRRGRRDLRAVRRRGRRRRRVDEPGADAVHGHPGPGRAVRAADDARATTTRAGAAGHQRRDHRRALGPVPHRAGRDRGALARSAPRPPTDGGAFDGRARAGRRRQGRRGHPARAPRWRRWPGCAPPSARTAW